MATTAKEYTDNLFTAIQNITQSQLTDLSDYDSTALYTIEEDLTKSYEKGYRVSNSKNSFIAYTMTDQEYSVGDSVYVLIPNNDLKEKKFIIGSKSSNTSAKPYISPGRKLVVLKKGKVEKDLKTSGSSVIIDINTIFPKFLLVSNEMRVNKKTEYKEVLFLYLSAKFQYTGESDDDKFYLKIIPRIFDSKTNKYVDDTSVEPILWNCGEMIGNYKNFMIPFKQEKSFMFKAPQVKLELQGPAKVTDINYSIGLDESIFSSEGIMIGADKDKDYSEDTEVKLEAYWIRKDKDGIYYKEEGRGMFEDLLKPQNFNPSSTIYTTTIKYKDNKDNDEPYVLSGSKFDDLNKDEQNLLKNISTDNSVNSYVTEVKIGIKKEEESSIDFYPEKNYKLTVQLGCAEGEDFSDSVTDLSIKAEFKKIENTIIKQNAFDLVNYKIKLNEETLYYDLTMIFKLKDKDKIVTSEGYGQIIKEDDSWKFSTTKLFPITIISDNSTLDNWSLFESPPKGNAIRNDDFTLDHEAEYFFNWYKANPNAANGWEKIASNSYTATSDLSQKKNQQTFKCELIKNELLDEDITNEIEVVFKNNNMNPSTEKEDQNQQNELFSITTIDTSDGKESSLDGKYYLYKENYTGITGISGDRYLVPLAKGDTNEEIKTLSWYFPYVDETMIDIDEEEILATINNYGRTIWEKIDSLEANSFNDNKATHKSYEPKNGNKQFVSYFGTFNLTKDSKYCIKLQQLPAWKKIKEKNFYIKFYNSIDRINNRSEIKAFPISSEQDYKSLINGSYEFTVDGDWKKKDGTKIFTTNTEKKFYIEISYQPASNTDNLFANTKMQILLPKNEEVDFLGKNGSSKIRWQTTTKNGYGTVYYPSLKLNKNNTYILYPTSFPAFEEIKGKSFRIDLYKNNDYIEADDKDPFKNSKNILTKIYADTDTGKKDYEELLNSGCEFTSPDNYTEGCILISYKKTSNNNTNYLKESSIKLNVVAERGYSNGDYKHRYKGYRYLFGTIEKNELKKDYVKSLKSLFKIPFALKNFYNPSFEMNTVICRINGKDYSKELQFGIASSQGTGYGLSIEYANPKREYIWYKTNKGIQGDDGNKVGFIVNLINKLGVRLSGATVALSLEHGDRDGKKVIYELGKNFSCNEKVMIEFPINQNKVNYTTGGVILVAKYQTQGSLTLTARKPLIFYHSATKELPFSASPSENGNLRYITGPTLMRYTDSGQLEIGQYRGPYSFKTSTGAKLKLLGNGPIYELYPNSNANPFSLSHDKNNDYYLSPPPIWYDNMENTIFYVRIKFNIKSETIYDKVYIPIDTYMNCWVIDEINNWNGLYGAQSNDPNFFPYIGIGEKLDENKYSGVYIGKTVTPWPNTTTNEAWWGIIGKDNEGMLTFGLRADKGQAYFKGDIVANSLELTSKATKTLDTWVAGKGYVSENNADALLKQKNVMMIKKDGDYYKVIGTANGVAYNYKFSKEGYLHASNAVIDGKLVVGTGGKVGSWFVDNNYLYSPKTEKEDGTNAGYAILKATGKVGVALGVPTNPTGDSYKDTGSANLRLFHSGRLEAASGNFVVQSDGDIVLGLDKGIYTNNYNMYDYVRGRFALVKSFYSDENTGKTQHGQKIIIGFQRTSKGDSNNLPTNYSATKNGSCARITMEQHYSVGENSTDYGGKGYLYGDWYIDGSSETIRKELDDLGDDITELKKHITELKKRIAKLEKEN